MKKHLSLYHFKNASIVFLFMCLFISSCNDYLDVRPEDKMIAPAVYNSKDATENVLNGIYGKMISNNLYGENLTAGIIEVLAQRFNTYLKSSKNLKHDFDSFSKYDYKTYKAILKLGKIWGDAYKTILVINLFIKGLDTYKGGLDEKTKSLFKGEALGLRAMLHFDLLRLFGPIYKQNPKALSIPYNLNSEIKIYKRLPADQIIKKVLADLSESEKLLAKDPIKLPIEKTDTDLNDLGDHYDVKTRKNQMNYFAVKALQARVNLYAGDTQKAMDAAKTVINAKDTSGKIIFPWTNLISFSATKDFIFNSEIIFGIRNFNMDLLQQKLFSGLLLYEKILAPRAKRLNETYENNSTDIRFQDGYIWRVPSKQGSDSYTKKTFFKFDALNTKKNVQPLIRLTEMYYILAEAEEKSNPADAIKQLNIVRKHRGILTDLPSTVNIEQEILKEYQKEFFGEGQLFFYYKRKNIVSIPDGSKDTGVIPMDASKYILPLPLNELQFQD